MTVFPTRFGALQLDKKSFQGRLTEAQIRQMNRQANVLAPAFDALEAQDVFVSLSNKPAEIQGPAGAWLEIRTSKEGEPVRRSLARYTSQEPIWAVRQVNDALVAGIQQLGTRARYAENQVNFLRSMQDRMQTLQDLQARLAALSQEMAEAVSNRRPTPTFSPEGGLPTDDGIGG